MVDAYRSPASGYRLHGQVVCGWFAGTDRGGRPAVVALSLQVLSTRTRRSLRRYGLNVVGVGPEGGSLEHFCHRLGQIPWSGPVRWAQTVLGRIASARGKEAAKERRIEGLLQGLARRLEKEGRGQRRRTQHAEQRHDSGERPTRMAQADLARAGGDDVLRDTRHQTLIVLGEKGRAHVFNPNGKLVTSIRYSPESIVRRRKEGHWEPAAAGEITALREAVRSLTGRR